MSHIIQRVAIAVGGLSGVAGVAAAAASAHGGDQRLMAAIALVALAHAPALVTLGIHAGRTMFFRLAILVMTAGLALFCGDLASRAVTGTGLFPMAAPAGGLALMVAWIAAGAGAFARNL